MTLFLHAFKFSSISSAYQVRMFIISSLTNVCFYSNNLRIAWQVFMKVLLNTTPNENVRTSLFKTARITWLKRDQLDVTFFFISLFNAQHISVINTSNLRSLRLICWVISLVVLLWYDACWCYIVVWLGWCGHKLLRMDVLTSKTCWAWNNEIKKQVTSSWSLFIQLSRWCTVQ